MKHDASGHAAPGLEASVIVPVLDQEGPLRACIESLLLQDLDPQHYEILVVDNGSSDRSREVASSYPVRLLQEPRPSSYAARNRGGREACGRALAFLDADCMADRGWLRAGLAALDAGKSLLAGGRIRPDQGPSPNIYETYDRLKYLDQERNVRCRGFAVTANLFVRRDAFRSLGGFDPGLVSGGDRDLCLRARRRGMTLAYVPGAVVRHRPRSDLRAILAKNQRLGFGTAQILRRRPREIPRALPMLLFPLPRRQFLLAMLRPHPPCPRHRLVPLFLLDWLAKQSLAVGCLKGAMREWGSGGGRA